MQVFMMLDNTTLKLNYTELGNHNGQYSLKIKSHKFTFDWPVYFESSKNLSFHQKRIYRNIKRKGINIYDYINWIINQ